MGTKALFRLCIAMFKSYRTFMPEDSKKFGEHIAHANKGSSYYIDSLFHLELKRWQRELVFAPQDVNWARFWTAFENSMICWRMKADNNMHTWTLFFTIISKQFRVIFRPPNDIVALSYDIINSSLYFIKDHKLIASKLAEDATKQNTTKRKIWEAT